MAMVLEGEDLYHRLIGGLDLGFARGVAGEFLANCFPPDGAQHHMIK